MSTERVAGVTDTDEPWRLLAETADFLIVSKPTRMLTQPGKEAHKTDSLITRVNQEFPEARIVHRLDWDTSGVMVLARHARAHRQLSIAFQDRLTQKRYIARVDRAPVPPQGMIIPNALCRTERNGGLRSLGTGAHYRSLTSASGAPAVHWSPNSGRHAVSPSCGKPSPAHAPRRVTVLS